MASAQQQVPNTTEFLESIILSLEHIELFFNAKRVSKQQNTVIATSPRIRQIKFIRTSPTLPTPDRLAIRYTRTIPPAAMIPQLFAVTIDNTWGLGIHDEWAANHTHDIIGTTNSIDASIVVRGTVQTTDEYITRCSRVYIYTRDCFCQKPSDLRPSGEQRKIRLAHGSRGGQYPLEEVSLDGHIRAV